MADRVGINCYVLGSYETNCYLVWSRRTRRAMAIDPGGNTSEVLAEIQREGLCVEVVVNTHGHPDHTFGNGALVKATGAPLAIGAEDAPMLSKPIASILSLLGGAVDGPAPDRLLRHGDILVIGDAQFAVRATPGHTPGGISLIGEGVAFTGDALFAGSIGRTDFPGGDEATLIGSIERELMTLGDDILIYPGHGPASTIGVERRNNPFLVD